MLKPISKVKIDLGKYEKLKKDFNTKKAAKVGVFGSSGSRQDGASNLSIAITHEFGSFSQNIPRRSFLKEPIEFKKDEIVKKVKKFIDKDPNIDKALEVLGIAGEAVVQEAFETQGFGSWQPLSPTTIVKKGSSSPLIDTGQLRKSVISKVE